MRCDMLKRKFLKKVWIAISCLIVIQIVAMFPKNDDKDFTIKPSSSTGIIYLLDDNNYVSRLEIMYNATKKEDLVREIISILTINSDKSVRIRSGFTPIIPENTELLDLKIEDEQVTLNFSKDILLIDEELEEKMIEAIVYSITSIDGINYVKLLVENQALEKLPHSSKKLPDVLDRSMGINKEYDIETLSNIKETTIYYLARNNDYTYYIPVTKYSNDTKEKIEIIIDELKSSSTYNTNLISYLNEETELINYELLDSSMILNFNDSILADINSNNIIEEVTYTINLSVQENYDVNNVIYYVDDQVNANYFLPRG